MEPGRERSPWTIKYKVIKRYIAYFLLYIQTYIPSRRPIPQKKEIQCNFLCYLERKCRFFIKTLASRCLHCRRGLGLCAKIIMSKPDIPIFQIYSYMMDIYEQMGSLNIFIALQFQEQLIDNNNSLQNSSIQHRNTFINLQARFQPSFAWVHSRAGPHILSTLLCLLIEGPLTYRMKIYRN